MRSILAGNTGGCRKNRSYIPKPRKRQVLQGTTPMGRVEFRTATAGILAFGLIGAAVFMSPAAAASKHVGLRLTMGAEQNNRPVTVTDDFVDEFGPTTSQRNSDLALFDTQLEFALRRQSRRHTMIRLRATAFRYTEATDRDFESFRLSVVQEIGGTSRDLAAIRARRDDMSARAFKLLRSFTVMNRSRVVAVYLTAPDRTLRDTIEIGVDEFGSLLLDRETMQLRYIQQLNRGAVNRFSIELAAARDLLDYSAAFDERDSDRNRLALAGNWYRLADKGIWRLQGGVQVSDLSSRTEKIGQPGIDGPIVADLGYDATTLPLTGSFEWYRQRKGAVLSRRNRAQLQLSYGEKAYGSKLAADTDRFARKDRFWILNGQYTHPLRSNLTVDFWGEYRVDRTAFDPLVAPAVGFEQPDDNVVVGFAINFYTGWQLAPDAGARRAAARKRKRQATEHPADEIAVAE